MLQVAEKHCSLCGEENYCMAGATEQGSCWCVQEKFPKGIFDLVPEESRNKQCICQKCVTKYKDESK